MPLAIVTGSSKGLGFEVAKELPALGFDQIVITSRTLASAQEACRKLKLLRPDVSYIPMALDLSDRNSVRGFAAQFKALETPWSLLVNNAGAKIESHAKPTKQGFEWHFGVNHLGHFLLLKEIADLRTDNAQLVSVSSIVASRAAPNWWMELSALSIGDRYAASKLANLVFAQAVSNHYPGLRSTAAHPGFARAEPYGNKLIRMSEYLFAQNAARGAKPIIEACKPSETFEYFAPRIWQLWGSARKMSKVQRDVKAQELLWQLSESMLSAAD